MTQKELKGMMVEEIVRLRKKLKAELNLRRLQPSGRTMDNEPREQYFCR